MNDINKQMRAKEERAMVEYVNKAIEASLSRKSDYEKEQDERLVELKEIAALSPDDPKRKAEVKKIRKSLLDAKIINKKGELCKEYQ